MFTKTGKYLSEFGQAAEMGFPGAPSMRFMKRPTAIAVHTQTDRLYIADSGYSRLVLP